MSTKRKFAKVVLVVAMATVLSAGLMVAQPALGADVAVDASGLSIAPGAVANFEAMNVRIAGPTGDLVLNQRSTGDAVYWSAGGMPDGEYRYEAVVLSYDPAADTGEEDGDTGERLERTWGSVEVKDGAIVLPVEDEKPAKEPAGEADDVEASLLDWLRHMAVSIARGTFDLLIPSAHAGNVTVSSSIPTVNYDDTDVTAYLYEWRTRERLIGGHQCYEWYDDINDNTVLEVVISANNADSFMVNSSGDISLANSAVTIDRSTANLGIGTAIPEEELHIMSGNPSIRLDDGSTGTWDIEENAGDLRFYNVSDGAEWMTIEDFTGEVGIGNSNPSATLHVRRSDGTAKLLVEETSASVAKRYLLELRNNGEPGFNLVDSKSGYSWQFSQAGAGSFIVSRLGTMGAEFQILKNGRVRIGPGPNVVFDLSPSGNCTIAGTLTQNSDVNSKENCTEVNGKEVLTRLQELPISTWNFKKDETQARHLGPMAQDFYSAFGLGADDRHIAPMDAAGVALAGVKELQEVVEKKDARIAQLEERLAAMEQKLTSLTEALSKDDLLAALDKK